MEGLDPAGCAGGVAYRWVTPFAAGQALAVPRQPPTIDRDSYVAFTGRQPRSNGGAPGRRSTATLCDKVIQRQES
jgi:hypothetical protein